MESSFDAMTSSSGFERHYELQWRFQESQAPENFFTYSGSSVTFFIMVNNWKLDMKIAWKNLWVVEKVKLEMRSNKDDLIPRKLSRALTLD